MPSGADGTLDPCDRYKSDKLRKHDKYLCEMRAQGITYQPIIWSAWGRAHSDASTALRALATRAARRRGLVAGTDLLREIKLDIALAIQARAARMVQACMPQPEDDDDF